MGLVGTLLPVPTQVMVAVVAGAGSGVAGFGVQVAPCTVLVVPGSTPVQVIATGIAPPALGGFAVQTGAGGAALSMTNGTVPTVVLFNELVTVMVGLPPKLSPVPVQLYDAPPDGTVKVAGEQPEIATEVPGSPPVQVIVTCVGSRTSAGLAVQTGNSGKPQVHGICNGITELLVLPAISSEVMVGFLPMSCATPVQVNVPACDAMAGLQDVPNTQLIEPGSAPLQEMVTV